MKALLVGYGQIGRAVAEVYGIQHDITIYDTGLKEPEPDGSFDVLLVAIPYSQDFVDIVNGYRQRHCARATIIFSTVAIGTTRQILGAVHCPIEGRHPDLAESLQQWPVFMGGVNALTELFFKEAFREPVVLECPEWVEFLKLRSTSLYGVNIEFARYTESVCSDLSMDYELVRLWDESYNDLYQELGYPEYQRYILEPPEGDIGGHCVVPNARILDKQYPSPFLKEIYRPKGGSASWLGVP